MTPLSPINSSTTSDPALSVTASGLRQVLSAASDAGLGALVSADSINNTGGHIVITFNSREVRALTNWLNTIAELHRQAPITASAIPMVTDSTPVSDTWMSQVTDVARTTPNGYTPAIIPAKNTTRKHNT